MANKDQVAKLRPASYEDVEIFEIKPVILGGSPTDPTNKIVLTREQHIKAVRYWTEILRKIRRGEE